MGQELFGDYLSGGAPDDEMFDAVGELWPDYRELARALQGWSLEEYEQRKARADLALLSAGITFNVYSEEEGAERIFPFSLIPRVVGAGEWQEVDAGLKQRLQALNLFLLDVYGEQRILKEKVVPEEIVLSSPGYKPEMAGSRPPLGVFAHVAGCDLVRDESREFVVLEDNLCTPSGVSYVLENRTVMLRVAPDLFPRGRWSPSRTSGSTPSRTPSKTPRRRSRRWRHSWAFTRPEPYQVSMFWRFLPSRRGGGGTERMPLLIHARESIGSITSSRPKATPWLSALPRS